MSLEKTLLYFSYFIVLGIWFLSLSAVYLPTSKWVTPTFPVIIDTHTQTMFLISSALASASSLLIDLESMGKLSDARKRS